MIWGRSGRHTAHHRIPRKTLYDITSKSATGSFPLSFKVFNAKSVKLSPIKLNYALMGCKLATLTVAVKRESSLLTAYWSESTLSS